MLDVFYTQCNAAGNVAKSVLGADSPEILKIVKQAELEFTPKILVKARPRYICIKSCVLCMHAGSTVA